MDDGLLLKMSRVQRALTFSLLAHLVVLAWGDRWFGGGRNAVVSPLQVSLPAQQLGRSSEQSPSNEAKKWVDGSSKAEHRVLSTGVPGIRTERAQLEEAGAGRVPDTAEVHPGDVTRRDVSAPNVQMNRMLVDSKGQETGGGASVHERGGASPWERKTSDATVDGNELRAMRVQIAGLAANNRLYPALARERGLEGIVEVSVMFNSSGDPNVSLARTSGSALLDQAAITMLNQASQRFVIPERLRGSAFRFVLPVAFSLDE